jgi:hypothetical protein
MIDRQRISPSGDLIGDLSIEIETVDRIALKKKSRMLSILPSAKTTLTPFDLMGRCKAILWLIFFIVSLVVALLVSFVPPNTSFTRSRSASPVSSPIEAITHRTQLSQFSSLSSFLVVWIRPTIAPFVAREESVNLTITANFQTFSSSLEPFGNGDSISGTFSVRCPRGGCDLIRLYQRTWVSFYAISMTATVEAEIPILHDFSFHVVCHSQIIAVVAFILISCFTIVTSLVFLISVSRRLRPSRFDHWATLFLGVGLFLIDGPWLILKYYTSRVASQIFDLAPEIFHAGFIVFLTIFIAERTVTWQNRVFSSWWIRGIILVTSLILIIVEFVITGLMPLCTLSIYLSESIGKYPVYTISALLHVAIILLLIFGVLSVQIEKLLVVAVAAFAFFILEAIYIAKMYIRFFIPRETVGVAFGADLFYILMANVVSIFFLKVNLPVVSGLTAETKDEHVENLDDLHDTTQGQLNE